MGGPTSESLLNQLLNELFGWDVWVESLCESLNGVLWVIWEERRRRMYLRSRGGEDSG